MDKKQPIITARQLLPWLIFLGILLFAIWASFADPDYLWLDAPGWSRARRIATTEIREAAPLLLDSELRSYLLYAEGSENAASLQVVSLDAAGQELWRQEVAAAQTAPTNLRLMRDEDRLHVAWLASETVSHLSLRHDGTSISRAEIVPFPEPVAFFDVVLGPAGLEFWASGPAGRPGLYAAMASAEPELVDAAGYAPQLRLDAIGGVHAIWQRQERRVVTILYAGPGQREAPAEVTQLDTGGKRLRGPWFVLDRDFGAVAWTIDVLQNPGAGNSFSKYVAFPVGAREITGEIQNFVLPYRRTRSYDMVDVGWPAGDRVALPDPLRRTATPIEAAPLSLTPGLGEESVVAMRVTVEHLKRRESSQIAIFYLENGEPNGYQLLSFTLGPSMLPSIAQSESGELAAVWLEDGDNNDHNIYFAGTGSALQEANGDLIVQDYGIFIMESLAGMVQSLTFAPFLLLAWSIAPLIILGVTGYWRSRTPAWREPAVYLSVILALGAFWLGKYFTLREAFDNYVPFSAWIPTISELSGGLLRLLIPVLILALSFHVAWRVGNRRSTVPVFVIFIVYACIDTALSMAIYGGILYNAF